MAQIIRPFNLVATRNSSSATTSVVAKPKLRKENLMFDSAGHPAGNRRDIFTFAEALGQAMAKANA